MLSEVKTNKQAEKYEKQSSFAKISREGFTIDGPQHYDKGGYCQPLMETPTQARFGLGVRCH